MHVDSNKILDLLTDLTPTVLANTDHVHLTSTPPDDLAESDFGDRVHRLVQVTDSLTSLTICIPSMARLHPSNSLPKVLDVLHDASTLRPHCTLGLIVHEAEQAWGALTVLKRIVELGLKLQSIEFTRAFFPVEALIEAAQACGLASLTLHATQVFSSSSEKEEGDEEAVESSGETTSISTLTCLSVAIHAEAGPGLNLLVRTATSTLTHLHLSLNSKRSNASGILSGSGVSSEDSVMLRGRAFPYLTRLELDESLLREITHARMPKLQELIVPALTQTENCTVVQESLQVSLWPDLQNIRVSRVIAGDVSDALTNLGQWTHTPINVTVGELAVRDPARLTPAALGISEHLVNSGPPIKETWPMGLGGWTYPRLKSIVLKVFDGSNVEDFLAKIDAPNLEHTADISVIGGKKKNERKR